MVFVKFHNIKQEKNLFNIAFKLKQTHKFSLYKSKQYYNHSSQMSVFFSSFFSSIYVLSILLKNVRSFLSFFLYAVFNNVQVFFFFFSVLFPLSCTVLFLFLFLFSFFFIFFIINCSFNVPFFQPYIYLSLSLP